MLVLIKGAGDLASGIAFYLFKAGMKVIMTDLAKPTVIRRRVSFAQAIYDGETFVEDVKGIFVENAAAAQKVVAEGNVAVLADPEAKVATELAFDAVVDAILAKVNLGTKITDAPIVIGAGPGFVAPVDVHAVVETQRGHAMGRVIFAGSAIPNTGVPGNIGGFTTERVLRAPAKGIFEGKQQIGDLVKKGDLLGWVGDVPFFATIDGVLRGILQDGLEVPVGMKIGDIDPRCEREHCFTLSDKARTTGGGVLLAVLHLKKLALEEEHE